MNPADPLANLHPLREPLPVGWWPPAPGWWLLAAVLLVAIAALAWWLWRRHRARAYRRQALLQLAQLGSKFEQEGNTIQFLADSNALLKSVALVAYPRRDVAASSGEKWLAFLNSALALDDRFPEEFGRGAYSKHNSDIDVEQILRAARRWIVQHRAVP